MSFCPLEKLKKAVKRLEGAAGASTWPSSSPESILSDSLPDRVQPAEGDGKAASIPAHTRRPRGSSSHAADVRHVRHRPQDIDRRPRRPRRRRSCRLTFDHFRDTRVPLNNGCVSRKGARLTTPSLSSISRLRLIAPEPPPTYPLPTHCLQLFTARFLGPVARGHIYLRAAFTASAFYFLFFARVFPCIIIIPSLRFAGMWTLGRPYSEFRPVQLFLKWEINVKRKI
jgi:hypothetical protein